MEHTENMTPGKKNIHIIEDEKDISDLIHFNLFKKGHEVVCSYDGEEGLDTAKNNRPDLILLDLMLPKIDGLEVCQKLKESEGTKNTPIIMITAKSEEEDIVKGLELGADDYITKPFSPKVLMARVDAVLRRSSKGTETVNTSLVKGHGIEIDLERRKVSVDGEFIELTFTEFQMLHVMLKTPGRVYTRGQIVEKIRGLNHAITDRSVDVQIVSLRKKLGTKGKVIETVRGVGYRMKEL